MENSILDTNVSRFANYDSPGNPQSVNLLEWLTSDKYKSKVEEIRKLTDKAARDKIKATLPAITPSGIFTYRRENSLKQHSGFIQFDIDLKGNEEIENYAELKKQLCNIKNIAYFGLSVSGQGYWGLVPIAYPNRHKEHFRALEMALKQYGIIIDPATKNIASLRGYSYDPDGYFNHTAEIFKITHVETQKLKPAHKKTNNSLMPDVDTLKWVKKYISEIENSKIDIAPDYETYIKIGFAFANEFGKAGRDLFHKVCTPSDKYIFDETEKDYSNFLKSKRQDRINTIATFFHYCIQAGISIDGYKSDPCEDFKEPLSIDDYKPVQ